MSCDRCVEHHSREIKNFISEYAAAISNDSAAIFAGAGLSIPSGELSWASLLRDDARNIGLDIDREDDYISVAQYIFNESGTRNTITKLIKNHVDKKGEINKNHEILVSMSIKTYWTTNYDTYIERALEEKGKKIDVKRSSIDLASEIEDVDATVFKMHGDIGQPNEVVLIKDDYEIYDRKNEVFLKKLQGDLLSNTFLFIGFSFDDPNLENILSKVRIMLEGRPRRHYCFFKRIDETDPEFEKYPIEDREKELKYRRIKQSLKIKDLLRYGIKAILVDEYEDITKILQKIRLVLISKNVFISGSYSQIEEGKIRLKIEDDTLKTANRLCERIGVSLYENNLSLINCLGTGVGRGVITGVLNKLYEQRKNKLPEDIIIKPFPDTKDIDQLKLYRTEIIKECGIAIFLFGNKIENEELIVAPGVLQEYEIAKEHKCLIIPVGSTGYAAEQIWQEEIRKYDDKEISEKKWFSKLNECEVSFDDVTEAIINLIKSYSDRLNNALN